MNLNLIVKYNIKWSIKSLIPEWSIVYVVILVCVLATAALCSACYFSFKNKTRRLLAMKVQQ